MTKVQLITIRRPNYLRAGIKFKDGQPLVDGEVAETVEVDVRQLKILQADDNVTVKTVSEPKTPASKETKPLTATQKFEAVKTAIAGLDKEIKANWTADGLPQVAAIETIVTFTVSAELRNKAWQALNGA